MDLILPTICLLALVEVIFWLNYIKKLLGLSASSADCCKIYLTIQQLSQELFWQSRACRNANAAVWITIKEVTPLKTKKINKKNMVKVEKIVIWSNILYCNFLIWDTNVEIFICYNKVFLAFLQIILSLSRLTAEFALNQLYKIVICIVFSALWFMFAGGFKTLTRNFW